MALPKLQLASRADRQDNIEGKLTAWPSGPAFLGTCLTLGWDHGAWRDSGHHELGPIVAAGIAAMGLSRAGAIGMAGFEGRALFRLRLSVGKKSMRAGLRRK